MKAIISLICAFLAGLPLFPASAAQPKLASQFDFSSDTTPAARKFYFETTPGQRYSLWRSTDLRTWQEVVGFPKVADGMSLDHTFAQQDKEFFQIEPIDEQAPTVVSQYPAVDGFAVGRFADLSIQLDDATGINPASIRLTVGASGQLAPGAPGLTISGNTITYDSGDAALGAWGVTISATLIAADTLGHTLSHTWSFRLEPEPQVAANIFVFGSPTAQRAGQRVSGPAAALAARYPVPIGPVKADDPPPWHIDSVLADRVVIAYEPGGVPSFAAGQLICNLAPTKESEIFYRRVVSTSNDAGNLKLTVMTSEATLTDFVSQGSSTFNENSVVYEVDEIGGIVSAIGGTLSLSKKTINLSGSSYKLRSDGYQATLAGIGTYSSGSSEPWLEVSLPEYQWSFQPTIKAEFEIGLSGLTFETIISGTNSLSTVLDAKVLLTGASTTTTLYDLPPEKEPFKLIYLGQLGPVPVWAVLKFDISIKSKAEAAAILEFSATYRQEHHVNALGFSKKPFSDWRFYRNVQSEAPDLLGSAALTGQFSLEIITDPRIEFLVYGLAGMKAGFEGKVGIETNASYGTGGGALGGKLTAGVDCFVGTSGPFLDLLGIDEQLSWKWWEGEWPLTPQNLAFKNQPQSRTAPPGEDVSFTCTVDSPSTPSFQWYHNGVLIPGQVSRSLFLSYVNAGHAGNYQVKATAGSLHAESAIAILTVQTVTPQNLDTDGDGIPDIYETNTGTWVSATNRGTNPYHWDSDGDGLSDGVETNTGVYISRWNTGTNPHLHDSDGDLVDDKREVDVGTNPNIPAVGSLIVIDGARETIYGGVGTVQSETSNWGPSNYLANIQAKQQGNLLNLFIGGKVVNNAILIFMDYTSGGPTRISNNMVTAGGDEYAINNLGTSSSNGLIFEKHFQPDLCLRIYGGQQGEAYVNLYDLTGRSRYYLGRSDLAEISAGPITAMRSNWQNATGDYSIIDQGIELALDLRKLGYPSLGHEVKVCGVIVNHDSTYGSNQTLAALPSGHPDFAFGINQTDLELVSGTQTIGFPVNVPSLSINQSEFAYIPAGTFGMGDSFDEGWPGERPVHPVFVSAMHVGRYEVTQELWKHVRTWSLNYGYPDLPTATGWANNAPYQPNYPASRIGFDSILKWCNARSEMEGLSPCYYVNAIPYRVGYGDVTCDWNANGYRIPTEAEWEKAARGGPKGLRFPWGNTISHNDANFYNGGSESFQTGTLYSHPVFCVPFEFEGIQYYSPELSPVGSFAPNGYGLFDVIGNAWEQCWDHHQADQEYPAFYQSNSVIDPRGLDSGYGQRVMRGGSINSFANECRLSSRAKSYSNISDSAFGMDGFRLVRSPHQ